MFAEQLPPVVGQFDRVPAAVLGVLLPFDEVLLLEARQHPRQRLRLHALGRWRSRSPSALPAGAAGRARQRLCSRVRHRSAQPAAAGPAECSSAGARQLYHKLPLTILALADA